MNHAKSTHSGLFPSPRAVARGATCGLALIVIALMNVQAQVKEESISFTSQPSQLVMSGTLSYPAQGDKFPAVILIWGSGPQTRDQVISGFPMFKIMADYFNGKGYAVLRFDKRGYGASKGPAGSEAVTTTAELADDVRSALAFLKEQPGIDTSHIGLLGHSEGTVIAEMVALEVGGVEWLALLGAPALSGKEIQTNQMCDNLLGLGAKPEVVEKVRPQVGRYLDFIISGYQNDSAYYAIGKDFLLAHGMEEADITHTLIDQLLDGFKTPWYRYYLATTPIRLIEQLKIPTFFLYGSEDENVTPETNVPSLLAMMASAEHRNMAISVLPGVDHFFEVKIGEEWTLSKALCPAIVNWLVTGRD